MQVLFFLDFPGFSQTLLILSLNNHTVFAFLVIFKTFDNQSFISMGKNL